MTTFGEIKIEQNFEKFERIYTKVMRFVNGQMRAVAVERHNYEDIFEFDDRENVTAR